MGGTNPDQLLKKGHGAWYRNRPVYIRSSRHTPPRHEAVLHLVPAFFERLEKETNSAVRVVLGHFIFVYIHPYIDGNRRIGRFIMNLMMAAGGYSWTIIPVEKRTEYMSSLEAASVEEDIIPFAKFLGELSEDGTHCIATVCSKPRFQRYYQFAVHRHKLNRQHEATPFNRP